MSHNEQNAENLINQDVININNKIKDIFHTDYKQLEHLANYYFDGKGKSIRPRIICSLAHILADGEKAGRPMESQLQIGLIAEMIHVASLIHDDIIDGSNLRRGKESINSKWGCNKAVLVGDFVLANAAKLLAQIGDVHVIECLSQVLYDLVQGELMQFGTKDIESERFNHYLTKTYRKTASLIANSCKAVALLQRNDALVQPAYEFGKNIGMAFQLVDDLLDFTAQSDKLGKPGCGADLKLGLATAPVLFAINEYPQLNTMVMRRFKEANDANSAYELVMKSTGIEQTQDLAEKYRNNAIHHLNKFKSNADNDQMFSYLSFFCDFIVKREK
jgi:decaprenyl-diphosphate synthase subunit 1